jgi:divalent metal cation (Fe/Co/Zn/Cd) transporter
LERRAVLLVGISFVLLAAYISWEAVSKLLSQEQPQVSWSGIGLAALSLVVMPLLAARKKRVALQLNSRALAADATETLTCSWLSAVLLGGLLLNALFGWWWADPVASLGIVLFLLKEGWEGIQVGRGKEALDCCGDG